MDRSSTMSERATVIWRMRIVIDILHPAHVHFFKNYIQIARARGDEVLVTSRDKDMTLELLNAYGIDHEVISKQRSGTAGLLTEWAGRTRRLYARSRRFRPHVCVGIMGVSVTPVSRALRTPGVVFYDTEIARRTNAVVYPMATAVVTPDSYVGTRRANQDVYPGYHELAYLHPNRFRPERAMLADFGISPDQPYTFVRFVGQDSSHDTDEIALTDNRKIEIVRKLAKRGKVIISSERPLPRPIAHHAITGPVQNVHHVLAYAGAVIGESATVAAEAAVLGTPSIFIGQTSRGYVDDLADTYGLIDRFTPRGVDDAIRKAVSLLTDFPGDDRRKNHKRMLSDKVDVTAWMSSYLDRFRPVGE